MKKIAIIGASYLQLPLVQKAKKLGLESHCFAWEEGAVCKQYANYFYPISILEKDTILEVCKEIKIDGIVSIASDAASATVCYIAESLGLISNPYADSLVASDKYKMRTAFLNAGLKTPLFDIANKNKTPDVSNYSFPIIVKPTDRSGSRGVMKIESEGEIISAVSRACGESFSGNAIIEEFITGVEVSVESISWRGKHTILAVTDKVTTGAPYFVELEHHQPSLLNSEIIKKIHETTLNALTALNIQYGASHSEFMISKDGSVNIIEVGARMGGDFIGSDLVQLSTGYDFVKGVIEVALGIYNSPCITESKYSGVYFLSKETEHLSGIIKNYKSNPHIVKAEITSAELKKIECSGDRSGFLIYSGNERIII